MHDSSYVSCGLMKRSEANMLGKDRYFHAHQGLVWPYHTRSKCSGQSVKAFFIRGVCKDENSISVARDSRSSIFVSAVNLCALVDGVRRNVGRLQATRNGSLRNRCRKIK